MKDNVYRTIFLIHLTVWVAFSLFTSAAHSSIQKKFEARRYEEIIKTAEPPLKPLQKLYLARSYFWLGDLQHVKAILNPKVHRPNGLEDRKRLRNLEDLSRKDRAQAFMYLGYSHLHLQNKSEACENFIKAFRLDPYLKFEKGALRDTRLEEIIKEIKIAVQIESRLDLFVVIDLSTSIPEKQVERIRQLQRAVLGRLKETDHVSFKGFGDFELMDSEFANSDIPYPVDSPLSASIVESLRIHDWTDFSTLFSRLEHSITNRKEPIDAPVSRKAVLIISDGEHSVKSENGAEKGKIPEGVTNAIEKFSESCPNIPIVIVTINQEVGIGSDYARLWTEEIKRHPNSIGEGFYYRLRSEPKDILDRVFKVITPMIVTRDPQDKNKGDAFIDGSCTVGVLIQCPLPRASLKVSVTPSDMFNCKWERAEEQWEDYLSVTRSRNLDKKVKITRLTQEDVQQGPRIITLTFFHVLGQGINQEEIGSVSVLFKGDQPTLQITRQRSIIEWWDKGETVILKSEGNKDLKFQTKIDLSGHSFKLPILLNATVPDNKCSIRLSKTELIPIDTTGNPGKHEFNLSVEAKRIDGFPPKGPDEDIEINFKIDDDSTKHQIDDEQVGKIKFRLVSEPVYTLYRISYLIGIFVILFLILFPFLGKVYKITPDETAVSDGRCEVFGDTIYDSGGKPVLQLRQGSWFGYLKRIENNIKSDIRQVVLLPQSSRKRRKVKTGGINSLDGNFLWPKEGYQIVLRENGGSESRFNIHWNYTYRIWYESLNRSIPYFGFFSIVFLSACFLAWFYVSFPFSLVQTIIFFVVLVVFIGAVYLRRVGSHRQESDLYTVDRSRKISSYIGLLDATFDILEVLQRFFP